MKLKLFLPLLFLLSLATSSCITTYYGANYKYTYSLTDTSNKIVLDTTGIMHFEDSVITVDFSIGQKQISFVMKNKSAHTIKINWDETIFNEKCIELPITVFTAPFRPCIVSP